MSFDQLGLSAALLRAVSKQGYVKPTPIQRDAIPVVLRGVDLMAGAQTGTGKTAAFALPVLQRLAAQAPGSHRTVRCLVLTPTRELASQVEESFCAYGRYLPLKSVAIFGGVSINPQINNLRRGVDILVATPGRLLDHVGQGTVDLSRVEILVLDEADRMLDMGFIHDVRRLIRALPKRRQNLMFSATFSYGIRRLADGLLHKPERIAMAHANTAGELVSQTVHPVDKHRKRELLSWLIGSENWRQVLVFTRTKHGANRLACQLETDGLSAEAIHGDKSQGARTRALTAFKNGKVRVLVATDIAARGLDIDQLPHVVNFELPNVPEDYVHRIGRTGRAGNEGKAVSLVCGEERQHLRSIETLLGRDLPKVVMPGYEPMAAGPDRRVQSGPRRPGGQTHRPGGQPRNLHRRNRQRAGRSSGDC